MPRPRSWSMRSGGKEGHSSMREKAHAAKLRGKGAMGWHTGKPKRGSRALAFKNDFIAMLGEYVGTVLFMIFALGGTNVALIPQNSITGDTAAGEEGTTVATVDTSNLLYISLCFGFSLAVNAWIFFRVSGGLFNPAVSLGMVLIGALTPKRGALLAVSQILGGITGAAIIQAVTPGTLNCRTTLAGGTTVVQGLFLEMFLTSLLMLAILLLAAEKHKATFIAPIGIGLALFVAELLGVYYTGGSLNPARSFGPDVVLHEFASYHWIYWLGPAMGATLAAGFYKLLKVLQYETVLGPEDGDSNSESIGATGGDEEKEIGAPETAKDKQNTKDGDKTYPVSGPGLGDLHTAGEYDEQYELRDSTATFDYRLDRIEHMIRQLADYNANQPRRSDLTYVEGESPKRSSRYLEDTNVGTASPRTRTITHAEDHRIAGLPKAELGPKAV